MADKIYDVIIVGAGAAGLMAAAEAARLGLSVLVLESQKEPGQKILIAGGGRCNVTNVRVSEKDYHAGCQHTLRHVLQTFSSKETVAFFERWGAPLALQPTGEYFSADDKARTVRNALVRAAREQGAEIICGARVFSVTADGSMFNVVVGKELYRARAALITTGGLSYPLTGSDGAGYRLAKAFGHNILPTRPALVPFNSSKETFSGLSGIVVPVRLSLWAETRKIHSLEGPLLFTHNGFSGPVAMEMSRSWLEAREKKGCEIRVDFLPSMKGEGVQVLLTESVAKRSIKNVLTCVLPERLVLVLLHEVKIDPQKLVAGLSNKEKRALCDGFRLCYLPVKETQGYGKAEVTSGGVDLKELKGATLESRLQPGLYFAGEVVDVDGRIGGFNLQWAWASGVAAARAIAKKGKA